MGMTVDQLNDLAGAPVLDIDGNRAGELREVFLDAREDHPAWALVQHGEGTRIVPLHGAHVEDDGLHVPYTGEAIDFGPTLQDDPAALSEAPGDWGSYYGLHGSVGADPAMDVPAGEEELPAGLSGYSSDRPAAHAAAYEGSRSAAARQQLRRHEFPDHPTGMAGATSG